MTALFPAAHLAAARAVIERCAAAGFRVATAESCTGGLIIGCLTEIAGSSAVVVRGYVTYDNTAKSDVLGVPAELFERVGAVSAEVACAMAEGALSRAGADLALACTGIAGPGGATPAKPVGLVHLACARRGRPMRHVQCAYGDIGRTAVRLASVADALSLLLARAAE